MAAIVVLVLAVFGSLGFVYWRARRPWATRVPVKRTVRGRVVFVVGWTAMIFGASRLLLVAANPSDPVPAIIAVACISGGVVVLRLGR